MQIASNDFTIRTNEHNLGDTRNSVEFGSCIPLSIEDLRPSDTQFFYSFEMIFFAIPYCYANDAKTLVTVLFVDGEEFILDSFTAGTTPRCPKIYKYILTLAYIVAERYFITFHILAREVPKLVAGHSLFEVGKECDICLN